MNRKWKTVAESIVAGGFLLTLFVGFWLLGLLGFWIKMALAGMIFG